MRWWVFFAVLTGSLALGYFRPDLAFSPGKLSQAHQRETQTCNDCHNPFQGIAQERCTSCHKPASFKEKSRFHQTLQGRCTACHSEHQGPSPQVARFDHELLAAEDRNNCRSCHVAPKDSLHAKSGDACASCHSTQAFEPATFDHARYFRFDRHHPETCDNCHRQNDYGQYTCYGCHEHSPSSIRREHEEEGIRNFDDCAACHASGNEHDIRRRGDRASRTGHTPAAPGPAAGPGDAAGDDEEGDGDEDEQDEDDDD